MTVARGRQRLLIAALATGLSLLTAVRPVAAQSAPDGVPAGQVVLRAGDGDRDAFVPPPVRISGTAGATDADPVTAASAPIQVTFAGGFPDDAKPAVQAALNIWGGLITSSQTINVHADYHDLGAGTLGTAAPGDYQRDFPGAPVAGTFYPQPLAEALAGANLWSGFDITMDFNVRDDWYFGTDGNTPSGQYDLMTTAMHEVLHGLGLLGTARVSVGQGLWGTGSPVRPDIYDRFTETQNGTDILNTSVYPNPSTALRNALQSGAVFFNSPQTNRGSSDRPRLFAPNPWDPGSSYSHLDEDTYPTGSSNSLATPFLFASEAVHSPGPIALCMLEALGWVTSQNCAPPASTTVTGFTWYSSGGYIGSGPTGTVIRAYATGASPGKTYKLVSGLDGGPDKPCMWDTQPINANNRVASSSGLIGTTGGVLNRGPGAWQICFREEGSGNTLQVSAPAFFQVT